MFLRKVEIQAKNSILYLQYSVSYDAACIHDVFMMQRFISSQTHPNAMHADPPNSPPRTTSLRDDT